MHETSSVGLRDAAEKKRQQERKKESSKQIPKNTEDEGVPKCLVLRQGKANSSLKKLIQDMRLVMMPNCAKSFKQSRHNCLQDFMAVSSTLGLSHILIFKATPTSTYLKVAKLPRGPTLTFRVLNYSLSGDIRQHLDSRAKLDKDFSCAPLQMLNGFASVCGKNVDTFEEDEHKSKAWTKAKKPEMYLASEMLRGLFPAANISNYNPAQCRRVALFHYDALTDSIHFRHFQVSSQPSGVHKNIADLLHPRHGLPELSKHRDMADYILHGGAKIADSEAGEEAMCKGEKTTIRLQELGPRLHLQLVKQEAEVCKGVLLYHRYMKRALTPEELATQKTKFNQKLKKRNARLTAQDEKRKADKLKSKQERKAEKEEGSDAEQEGYDELVKEAINDDKDDKNTRDEKVSRKRQKT